MPRQEARAVRRFWLATVSVMLATVVALRDVPSVTADELVVSAGSDPSVQVSGPWRWAATSGTGGDGGYLFRDPAVGGATVFWPFPVNLSSGDYEVYARWASAPNHASSAVYWVASDDGTLGVRENQQTNAGVWQLLGTYHFQPGVDDGVTLTDSSSGVVVADAIRWVGPLNATNAAAADVTAPTPPPMTPETGPIWTVTLKATDLHAGPDASTVKLASVPQFTYLRVIGYQGDWAYVFNPRAGGTAYAVGSLLGPSDAPPAWVTAPPPKPSASIEQMGRTVGTAPLAYYPVDDKFAYTSSLGHNVAVMIHDRVEAANGSTWYRVDGGYLAANSVRLPRSPTRSFSGRWLDADLHEPAMLTAYEGDRVVLNALAIKGTKANQTPTGTFFIGRRVQDETMDSGTIGIDAHAPGGYHLEHVLYTQYFTQDGASIHYNYWSSNFGSSGSHGCLGLNLQDSLFLWNWADVGTPVVIRS